MRRKMMGRWVVLDFNGVIRRAKIVHIEFHHILKRPVFHLISQLGNEFRLTKEELEWHEVFR
jgi:hypothetical protein